MSRDELKNRIVSVVADQVISSTSLNVSRHPSECPEVAMLRKPVFTGPFPQIELCLVQPSINEPQNRHSSSLLSSPTTQSS